MPPSRSNFSPSGYRWSLRSIGRFAVTRLAGLLLTLFLLPVGNSLSWAQDLPINSDPQIDIGFSGTAKLGQWVPVSVTTSAGASATAMELSTLDGDQSPVTYGPFSPTTAESTTDARTWVGLCRLGRRYGALTATLVDDQDKLVVSHSIDLASSKVRLVSSTSHLTLLIGGNQDLDRRLKSILGVDLPDSDQYLINVEDVDTLPSTELGWQSVNRLIVSSASAAQLASLRPPVWNAIKQWVGGGGELILIADPDNLSLFNDTPLGKLCGANNAARQLLNSSRELERFVSSGKRRLINQNDPGIPFVEVSELDNDVSVLLTSAKGAPLVTESAEGFGRTQLVTFNLEAERLKSWPGYGKLLEKIFAATDENEAASRQRQEPLRAGSAVTHYGYEDIIGQLRVPLDDFSKVRFLDFTLIAILIALYITCISLGDYFLLNRFLKKMELTWVTFPLWALLFCGIAWGIVTATRPSELQINQMEIIDFDVDAAYSRGTAWVNIYSPSAQKIDVAVAPQTGLGLEINDSSVTWQGLPGGGLGGLETEANTGFKRTGYRQRVSCNSQINRLPLQVSSTRSLVSQFKIQNPPRISSQLRVKRDRLSGTLKNPMTVPLFNGKVFFGSYVYLLKKTLQPGAAVYLDTDANEKTIRTVLNRRYALGTSDRELGKSQSRPWDPRDKNLTRIADIMMFYQVAGGKNYTGLTHGYFPQIDHSHLLKLNRAVLVGQVQSASALQIDGQDATAHYDSSVSMVRVVLPVENRK